MRTKRCSARTVVGDGFASSNVLPVAHYYSSMSFLLLLLVPTIVLQQHPASSSSSSCLAMSLSSSFHGARVATNNPSSSSSSSSSSSWSWSLSSWSSTYHRDYHHHHHHHDDDGIMVMRKQKASDRRTARMQRGGPRLVDGADANTFAPPPLSVASTTTRILGPSPMSDSPWRHRSVIDPMASGGGIGTGGAGGGGGGRGGVGNNDNDGGGGDDGGAGGGRGRARKRLRLYNSLASYHSTFLDLISEEYRVEESEVISRIESSISDPFALERCGHALFDVHPQRRGNLFADEVYRLEKSRDATTTFHASVAGGGGGGRGGGGRRGTTPSSPLPPNHNFSRNDVIVLTLQPRGTGDFLGTSSLPTTKDAVTVEARILNVGPAYLDVAIPAGKYADAFGPASNNAVVGEGKGDPDSRVRVDRFFSDVPFRRMVAALGQLTSVPERRDDGGGGGVAGTRGGNPDDGRVGGFRMDALLKEAVLSTFAIVDEMASSSSSSSSSSDGGAGSNPGLGDLVSARTRVYLSPRVFAGRCRLLVNF